MTRVRSNRWDLVRSARAALSLALVAAACGPSEVGPLPNPVPVLQSLDPALVVRSSASVTVDALGVGFVDGAEARWNGESRATTYQNDTRITVTLTAQDLQAASGEIDVVNPEPGGGASETVTLVVGNPAPTLTGISPTTAPAVVTSTLALQVSGADFVVGPPGSVALWDGVPLSTDVVSPTELTAEVPDYLLRTGRAAAVTVSNPAPGGGESNAVSFDVENPVPVVTGTDPDHLLVDSDTQVSVLGSGFVYGASVWIDDTELQPYLFSGSRVTVQVPGALAVGATSLSVKVENPAPAGGLSNGVDLPVWLLPPQIDGLFPSSVYAGASDFTLVISGLDFAPDATVTWNSDPRAATVVTSSRIELDVPAADVATAGTVEVGVTNPGEGSSTSAEFIILTAPPIASRVVVERWAGMQIAFSQLDGSAANVVDIPSGAFRVDGSPVGPAAVYHGPSRIFELDEFTGLSRRVTTAAEDATLARESWPRYSADGVWVYFIATPQAGDRSEIWRAHTDGSGTEPVLSDAISSLAFVDPSNAGGRLVYVLGDEYGGSLYIYDLNAMTSTPLGVAGLTSRWSPDDQWIVYLTTTHDLRAIRPDGSGDFGLVTNGDVGHGFDFSSDGNYIVGTTQSGEGIMITFPTGDIQSLPGLGQIGSVSWYGP